MVSSAIKSDKYPVNLMIMNWLYVFYCVVSDLSPEYVIQSGVLATAADYNMHVLEKKEEMHNPRANRTKKTGRFFQERPVFKT